MAEDTKVLEVVLELRDMMTAKLKASAAQAGKANTAFATLTKTVARLAAAYIGFQGIKSAINMIVEFDVAMRNVNSIMRVGEKEFQRWSKALIDLSRIVPQSADVLAKGLYDIASSGFEGAEAFDVLKASAKAASAGLTSTAVSVKAIAGALNAFGTSAYTADEVADILFKTVDKGVITFEELAGTIGMVNSSAAMVGVPLEQVGAAIAEMTKKGLEAPIAMTGLSNLLRATIAPSEKMAAAIKRFGFESGEALLKAKGLPGLLKMLQEASGGSAAKLAELIPEIRGTRAAAALLSGEQGLAGTIRAMDDFTNSTGATQRALDEQKKSIKFVYELIKNNFKAALLDTANLTLPSVTEATQDNAKAWADWGYSVGKVVGEVGLLAAQMANAIRAVFDTLMLVVTSVVGGIAAGIAGIGRLLERMSGRLFEWVDTAQGVADASLGAIGSYNAGTGYAGGIGNASDLAKDLYKRQKALIGMGASADMSAFGAGRSGIPGGGDSTGTGAGAGSGTGGGGDKPKTIRELLEDAMKANVGVEWSRNVGGKKVYTEVCAWSLSNIIAGTGLPITPTTSSSNLRQQLIDLGAREVKLKDALPTDFIFRKGNKYGTGVEHSQMYAGGGKAYGEGGKGIPFGLQNVSPNSMALRLPDWMLNMTGFAEGIEEATSALGEFSAAAKTGASHFGGYGVAVRATLEDAFNSEFGADKDKFRELIAAGYAEGRGLTGAPGISDRNFEEQLKDAGIDPNLYGFKGEKKNRTGFAQLTSNEFLMNALGSAAGIVGSGGGGRELAAGLLPLIGSAFGPIGAVVGGLLGNIFGKKKQQQPVTEAIPVKVVNIADMATAFLSATQSRRMIATAPGMQRLTTQLNMQALQVGVV